MLLVIIRSITDANSDYWRHPAKGVAPSVGQRDADRRDMAVRPYASDRLDGNELRLVPAFVRDHRVPEPLAARGASCCAWPWWCAHCVPIVPLATAPRGAPVGQSLLVVHAVLGNQVSV